MSEIYHLIHFITHLNLSTHTTTQLLGNTDLRHSELNKNVDPFYSIIQVFSNKKRKPRNRVFILNLAEREILYFSNCFIHFSELFIYL